MQEVRDAQVALNDAEAEGARNGIKLNKQLKMLNRQANADAKEANDARKERLKERQKLEEDAYKVIMDTAIALASDRDKELINRSLKYNEDVLKLKKAGIKDLTAVEESYNKDVAAINKKFDDAAEKTRIEKQQKEYADLQAQTQGMIDESNRQIKKITDKDLEKANNEKLSFDARLAAVTDREKLMSEMIFKTEDERTAYEKANADARKKIAKDEAQAKVDQLNFYSGALNSIAGLLGQSTDAGKAAAIASTTISTYLAAQGAYASQMAIPTPDAPFRAALAAGLAVTSGLMNVQKIIDTPTPNGGGGGSAPSASIPQAPSFNVVGTSPASANQIAKTTQSQAPIKAYVVSQDVTTQQALDRNIVKSASLG